MKVTPTSPRQHRRRFPDRTELLRALAAIAAYAEKARDHHSGWPLCLEMIDLTQIVFDDPRGVTPGAADSAMGVAALVRGLAWLNGNGDRGPPNYEELALALTLELAVTNCEAERSRLSGPS